MFPLISGLGRRLDRRTWLRSADATAKRLSQSRYAALLVSMHVTAMYERRNPATLDAAERQLRSALTRRR